MEVDIDYLRTFNGDIALDYQGDMGEAETYYDPYLRDRYLHGWERN